MGLKFILDTTLIEIYDHLIITRKNHAKTQATPMYCIRTGH